MCEKALVIMQDGSRHVLSADAALDMAPLGIAQVKCHDCDRIGIDAPMKIIPAIEAIEGGFSGRKAHFSSLDTDDHHPACSVPARQANDAKTLALLHCLKTGSPVIVTLNIPHLAPQDNKRPSRNFRHSDIVRRQLGDVEYKTVSVKSADDYLKLHTIIKSFRELYPDAPPANVHVSFLGHLYKPKDMFIDNDHPLQTENFLKQLMMRSSSPQKKNSGLVQAGPMPITARLTFSQVDYGVAQNDPSITSVYLDPSDKFTSPDIFMEEWHSAPIPLSTFRLPRRSFQAVAGSAWPYAPWNKVVFAIRSDQEDINYHLRVSERFKIATRLITRVNETALRSALYAGSSSLKQDKEADKRAKALLQGGTLLIYINLFARAQIVGAVSNDLHGAAQQRKPHSGRAS